ncbi:DUF3558 family protein [Allokutzneria oryzae]|uniref:DUF3558 family protein n=1 Tax=Allokutzneria oryzae TaxID=1378989 RepID=A0ABV6A2F6_9PSEU
MADPTPRRGFALLGLALLALPLTGCVTVVAGGDTATTTPTTPAVQRPRVLDMTNIDPCTLLTPEQQRTFGIDLPPSPDDSAVHQAKSCYFANEKGFEGLSFTPIPHKGIDQFAPGKVNAEVRNLTASGFPAKENFTPLRNPDLPRFCFVIVDVAPGQVLETQYTETARSGPPVLTRDDVCKRAAQAADAAITTLMNKN